VCEGEWLSENDAISHNEIVHNESEDFFLADRFGVGVDSEPGLGGKTRRRIDEAMRFF